MSGEEPQAVDRLGDTEEDVDDKDVQPGQEVPALPDVSQYSDAAFDLLRRLHVAFVNDLAQEAERLCRADRVDTVSRRHVDDADRIIRSGHGARRTSYLTALGGLVGGAGLTQLTSMISRTPPAQYSLREIVVTIGLLVLSAALLSVTLRE